MNLGVGDTVGGGLATAGGDLRKLILPPLLPSDIEEQEAAALDCLFSTHSSSIFTSWKKYQSQFHKNRRQRSYKNLKFNEKNLGFVTIIIRETDNQETPIQT